MDKNFKNTPMMVFSPICEWPQDFFQKSSSVTFAPLSYLNFMQKIRKTDEQALRYLKTDKRTEGPTDRRMDKGDY